jgi:hypothetical protein
MPKKIIWFSVDFYLIIFHKGCQIQNRHTYIIFIRLSMAMSYTVFLFTVVLRTIMIPETLKKT